MEQQPDQNEQPQYSSRKDDLIVKGAIGTGGVLVALFTLVFASPMIILVGIFVSALLITFIGVTALQWIAGIAGIVVCVLAFWEPWKPKK